MAEREPPRPGSISRHEEIEFFLFIMPWMIGFICFSAIPIIASLVLAAADWSMLQPPTWVGLGNYAEIFGRDPFFKKSLVNTVYYVFVSVPAGIVLALAFAILLNQKVIARPFYRTCFYVPSLVTGISVAVLWSWLLNPQFGLINYSLSLVGIQGPEWLYNTKTAMPAMIVMSLWGVGGSMVIYLAGLQGIPEQYYEAAEIDGAGTWKKFQHITVPMITPTIFFTLIMGVIGAFQTFTQFFVMTNGGPANATLTYVLYLYRNAFEYFRMGYAAALAWILLIIILVVTALQFWGSRHWVYYEGELRR
jgi:multiple sugar transport system permease protein